MKITVIKASTDLNAYDIDACLKELDAAVYSYMSGLGFSNPKEWYDIYEEDDCIRLNAELSFEEFSLIADKLDSIVQKLEKDAYFDCIEPGIFLANISDEDYDDDLENDQFFNKNTVENAVNKIVQMIDDKMHDDFNIDSIEIYKSNYDDENDDAINMYVDISSDKYTSLGYAIIYRSTVKSISDLIDKLKNSLYFRLLNNMEHK